MPKPLPKPYKPTRRHWVKLWIDPWLDGTTRLEMSGAQRAFWLDLIALGGRSRHPGIICSGEGLGEGEKRSLIGYPLLKIEALVMKEIDVEETLRLFESSGKITVKVTQEKPVKLAIITICNWEKYQSEYLRQRKYRDDKNGYNGNRKKKH